MSPLGNIWGLITNNSENKTPAALTGVSSCLAVLPGHQDRIKNMSEYPDLHPGAAASHTCTVPGQCHPCCLWCRFHRKYLGKYLVCASSTLINGTSLAMFGFGKWAEKRQEVKAINIRNKSGVHRQCWCKAVHPGEVSGKVWV